MTDTENLPIEAINKEEKSFGGILKNILKNLLAIIFWTYLIISTFLFSLDILIIKYLPHNLHWIVQYKFVVFFGLITIICLITKKLKTLGYLSYIIFYPLVLIFYLCIWFWKKGSWNIFISFIDLNTFLFNNAKFKFLNLALSVAIFTCILKTHDILFLWVCIILLFILLLLTTVYFLKSSFETPIIYRLYIKFANFISKYATNNWSLSEELKTISRENYSDLQLQAWSNNLQQIVLLNRASSFFAKKLKEYNETKIGLWFSLLGIIIFMGITTFSFSFIYFAFYKINHNFFIHPLNSNWGDFFYFSFNYGIFSDVYDLSIAQGFWIKFFSLLHRCLSILTFGGFLFSVFLSQRESKINVELERVLETTKQNNKELDLFISKEFGLDTQSAVIELGKIKSSLFKLISYFSK